MAVLGRKYFFNFPSVKKYFWQKDHIENLTGTEKAYRPNGSLKSDKPKYKKKYDTWNP